MKKNSAHWIQETHVFRDDEFKCSACGGKTEKPFPVGPRCGKPMKGSKYDPSWVDEAELMEALLED